jgi:glycerol-3-phosphate acyltransferase PlsX
LGTSLATTLLKIKEPTIGLLNVGKEKNKGNEIIHDASTKLTQLKDKGLINYAGYIEGSDISMAKLML